MVSNCHAQRKKRISARLLILILFMVVQVSGCSAEQKDDNGIRFIAPLGSPPADSIVWSPIENKILVTAGDVGLGRAQVFIFDMETGRSDLLAKASYGDFVRSVWSPDGRQVLLLAREKTIGDGAGGLWIFDIQTRSLEYFLGSGQAAWSPNGITIAAFSFEDDDSHFQKIILSLIDVKNRNSIKIYETADMKYFFGTSWSSDGENLAFALGENLPGNLYTIDVQTRQVRQITENTQATGPDWSPHANIIAYTKWPSEGSKTTLHLIYSDGRCDTQIPGVEYAWSPTWSPDGRWLGYVGKDGIYILEIEKVLGRDIYQGLCK